MPFSHGSRAVFRLGDANNTLVDITQYLSSVSMSFDVDTADATTLSSTTKRYITGMTDYTISLEGKFDPVADALFDAIRTLDARNWEYGPQGSATGNVRYTGTATLTSYEITAGVDGALEFSVELQGAGTLTRSTY